MAKALFTAPATSWKPVLEKRAEESAKTQPSGVLSEEAAIKTVLDIFKFNASSRAVEKGPYAKSSPRAIRCIAPTNNGLCNLATKKGAQRCDIHTGFSQLAALDIDARAVHEGSAVEAALRARAEELKLKL